MSAIKAIFFDLDETLCDTTKANQQALALMAKACEERFAHIDAKAFSHAYIEGIYRNLSPRYTSLLLPVENEAEFRLALIDLILKDLGISDASDADCKHLQQTFDTNRTRFFDFFDGLEAYLAELYEKLTVIIITNGPAFSQVEKVKRVQVNRKSDHVLIGGLEPEQKPAKSIFEKALTLADCAPNEVIHIGDSLKADIQGAINAGITCIWVQHGQTPDASIKPDYTIEYPQDLKPLLDRLISA